jgi:hypothetical protein
MRILDGFPDLSRKRHFLLAQNGVLPFLLRKAFLNHSQRVDCSTLGFFDLI